MSYRKENGAAIAFGKLVRESRVARGWSQEALAAEAFPNSTRKGYISQVENGKIPNITRDTVRNIAHALEIDPEHIPDVLRWPEATAIVEDTNTIVHDIRSVVQNIQEDIEEFAHTADASLNSAASVETENRNIKARQAILREAIDLYAFCYNRMAEEQSLRAAIWSIDSLVGFRAADKMRLKSQYDGALDTFRTKFLMYQAVLAEEDSVALLKLQESVEIVFESTLFIAQIASELFRLEELEELTLFDAIKRVRRNGEQLSHADRSVRREVVGLAKRFDVLPQVENYPNYYLNFDVDGERSAPHSITSWYNAVMRRIEDMETHGA